MQQVAFLSRTTSVDHQRYFMDIHALSLGICGVCHTHLSSNRAVDLPCRHTFRRSSMDDIIRHGRYSTGYDEMPTTDCMFCGSAVVVPSLPGFARVLSHRPLPRQVRGVRVDDGLPYDENGPAISVEDGSLECWRTFPRQQQQRGGSVLLVAFRRGVTHVAYAPFIPAPGWGVSMRQLRQTDLNLLQSGLVQSVLLGMWSDLRQWARDVDSAVERASTGSTNGNSLPRFTLSPS